MRLDATRSEIQLVMDSLKSTVVRPISPKIPNIASGMTKLLQLMKFNTSKEMMCVVVKKISPKRE